MKIMHVEAGQSLYGGAQQVDGLRGKGIDTTLAKPRPSGRSGFINMRS